MRFSCSTMWNIRQHKSPIDALKEMKEVGFEFAELNYLVTKEMLDEIIPFVEKGGIKISSVHNVIPKVNDRNYGTDSMLLGYLDEEMRKESVRLTKISLDYGHILDADGCVIHPCEVPVSRNFDNELKNLYKLNHENPNQQIKDLFKKTFNEFQTEKRHTIDKVNSQTIKSLYELSDYSLKKGYNIKISIENRSMIHQLPTFLEAEYIFKELGDAPVFLWYDIGHGIMMEELGLLEVFPIITKLQNKIAGMHIHDAKDGVDHFVPYHFGDEFRKYLNLIKNSYNKVIEVGPKCSKEDVAKSIIKLKNELSILE